MSNQVRLHFLNNRRDGLEHSESQSFYSLHNLQYIQRQMLVFFQTKSSAQYVILSNQQRVLLSMVLQLLRLALWLQIRNLINLLFVARLLLIYHLHLIP